MQAVLPQYLHNSHTLNVSSCPSEFILADKNNYQALIDHWSSSFRFRKNLSRLRVSHQTWSLV